MPVKINDNETDFWTPGEAKDAQDALLSLIQGATTELYTSDYAFCWVPLWEALQVADKRGVKVHVLVDLSQSARIWSQLQAFRASLTQGDVTVTTAGPTSPRPSQINHTKAMWTPEGVCWEGSVNFSMSGWEESNTCRLFTSVAWAQMATALFISLREWALTHVKQLDTAGPTREELLALPPESEI